MELPIIDGSWQSVFFLVFAGCFVVQMIYLFWIFTGLLPKPAAKTVPKYPGISIVISARNEEDNLHQNIPAWCEQNYPNFEVIIVNDQSFDDSKYIVKAYQKKYKNLRLVDLERVRNRRVGKKLPLTVGIKGAKFEYILLTDADCKPASNVWIRRIASNFTEKKQIVLGYSPYLKKKGMLNAFIRFDAVFVALQYLNLAKRGVAYMGVGRNLGYHNQLFHNVSGFKSHYHIPSGDDDLFIQEVAKKRNFTIDYHPESFVYTNPKTTWRAWFSQKKRHFQTAPQYKVFHKALLGIFPMTLLLMLFSFVILLFVTDWWAILGTVIAFRYIGYWILWGVSFKRLGSKDLIYLIPIFEIIFLFVLPIIYTARPETTEKKWQ